MFPRKTNSKFSRMFEKVLFMFNVLITCFHDGKKKKYMKIFGKRFVDSGFVRTCGEHIICLLWLFSVKKFWLVWKIRNLFFVLLWKLWFRCKLKKTLTPLCVCCSLAATTTNPVFSIWYYLEEVKREVKN